MEYLKLISIVGFTSVLGAGCLLFAPAAQAQNRPAPGDRGFWCDASTGTPTTMYQNAQGGVEPWIRWTSSAFSESGYDQMTRCRQVSSRLETYRRNKQLKLITVGTLNSQRVVCTASQVNGRCEGLIFTLKPNADPIATLNNLLAWREGQVGAPSLSESGAIPFIDVSGRLGEDSTSSPSIQRPVRPAPQAVPQPIPQPSSGGGREL